MKIDNIGSFGGVVLRFSVGDTIDLGTLLRVGTLAYSTATNLLALEVANGTTLATLLRGNVGTGYATGTFGLVNGEADGFVVGVGADGDTVLTSSVALLTASGVSCAWQSTTSWTGGIVPGTTDQASIGNGATSPFTLTTGGVPVTVGGFSIQGSLATVAITTTGGSVGGSTEGTAGATPSSSANTGQPGVPAINRNINNPALTNTPASGGAVSGTASNPETHTTEPSGAGATATNQPAKPTQADVIVQRQQAVGVAAPAPTRRGEEATLDQLDQKLEAASGVSPRCPRLSRIVRVSNQPVLCFEAAAANGISWE